MIKQATINSSTFSISGQCRCDAKYGIFVSQDSWNAFQYNGQLQALSDLLIPLPISKVSKGELNDDYYLINISDQTPGEGIIDENNVAVADVLNSDKTILSDCDILVSKLGMTRGYIYLKPESKMPLIGSSEFIPYKLRDNTNGLFYLYLLLMPQMRNAYRCLETGKTPSHKRVNPTEFLKICVPVLKKDLIETANEKIKAIIAEIITLNSQKVDTQIIVDEVFSRHFSLDPDLRNKLHKGMTFGTQSSTNTRASTFTTSITTFPNYFGLRFSARSHTPIIDNILNILKDNGVLTIDEITNDIHNGKKPIYSPEEEIAVIKTTNISNNGISLNEVEYVTKSQYDDTPDAQILPGDILICNIGKCSLGKVDICDSNDRFFAATETMIVRVDKEKYDPYFLLYYLRSVFGTAQFEREYTGTTNQIHISPDNVRNFIVPNISIDMQKTIVSEIQSRISSQDEISLQVSKLRQDINQVILDVINAE